MYASNEKWCFSYCQYAVKHNWLTFSKMGKNVFSEKGCQNWKKAIEKFTTHKGSLSHTEAKVKWMAKGRPTILSQLYSQTLQVQKTRAGLMCQLRAVQYLARQGIAFQSHTELMVTLSNNCLHGAMKLRNLKSGSSLISSLAIKRQTVNEIISITGQNLLRNLLDKIQANNPSWFSVTADEATDVCNSAQLNLSIRWVNNKYEVFEDTVGLFRVQNTKAETLFMVIKDLLTRKNLIFSLCRGQAYDGAANIQGKRSGIVARFLNENPATIPVHWFAYSLNLSSGNWKKYSVYQECYKIVKEVGKLILYSPK